LTLAPIFFVYTKPNNMDIIPLLVKEMEFEATTTRKMLKLVPVDKFDWKPHEKSMSMKNLAVHVAEIPGWVAMALNTSEVDFGAQPYEPTPVSSNEELLQTFEKSFEEGITRLKKAKEEELLPEWTMRNGETIYAVFSKYEVIRHSFAQITHHRAQLGVYLRLLNVPIPGSYGPSADEMNF
jgi:uncharacterized damage-inducible protein DinB